MLVLIWPSQSQFDPCSTVLMKISASSAIKTWRKHRHRNALSYYQLGVHTGLKRPYTKRRGSRRLFYLHPAVSTHEICRPPPPPPRQSSVLNLERLEGITGIRERNQNASCQTDAAFARVQSGKDKRGDWDILRATFSRSVSQWQAVRLKYDVS